MIKCQMEQLPQKVADDFHNWITRPEYHTLVRMGESLAKKFQVEALTQASKAHDGNLKLDLANEMLRRSQRYLHFLEVLEELSSIAEPQIAKLS